MKKPKPHHRPRENFADRPVRVDVVRAPEPAARDELLDALFELLDPVVHSGGK